MGLRKMFKLHLVNFCKAKIAGIGGVRIFFCKLSFCGKIYIFQGRAFVLPSYNIS